jgi:hypothetical protein
MTQGGEGRGAGGGGEGQHKPFDGFAKEFLAQELSPIGEIDSPAIRIAPEQYIDIEFVRSKQGQARSALMGELAGEVSLWEPFSTMPALQDRRDNLEKHWAYDRSVRGARGGVKRYAPPHCRLWILSPFFETPTHPIKEMRSLERSLVAMGFAPDAARGPGFWEGPSGFNAGVIVLEQLPQTDDTLALRLLGRGSTLEAAIVRLRERAQGGDPDDLNTFQRLHDWGLYQQTFGDYDPWLQDLNMRLTSQQAYELARQRIIEQASPTIIEQARPQIVQEAKAEAYAAMLCFALERAEGRPLSEEERAEVARVVEGAEQAQLLRWITGAEPLPLLLGERA